MSVSREEFEQLRGHVLNELRAQAEAIDGLRGELAVTNMAVQALMRAGSAPGEVLHRVFEQFAAQHLAREWSPIAAEAANEALGAIRRQVEEMRQETLARHT
ncbi:MAG: hypothetical protein ACREO4_06355 [Lysobacter sp.]